jgi:hypothetical protein
MRAVDRNLADQPDVAIHLFKVLWPEEEVPASLTLTSDCLKGAGRRIREWQCSAARAGADAALRVACSWYPDLDLDALHGVRENSPTDTDPVLTAKRRDRAYRIAEYASVRTFIPLLLTSRTTLAMKKRERTRKMRTPEKVTPFRKLQRPVLLLLKLLLLNYLL